jgi:hypothetical protein
MPKKRLSIQLITTILSLLLGIFLAAVALFAVELGIDNDAGWGKGRFALLALGILFMCLALTVHFWKHLVQSYAVLGRSRLMQRAGALHALRWIGSVLGRISTWWQRLPFIAWLNQDSDRAASLFGWSSAALVILFTVWYLTTGTWTKLPQRTFYFDMQAQGFLAGKTHLLVEPPAELAALDDPYRVENRAGIHYLWDVSYYQGKYYLYWGAVPSLVVILIKPFIRQPIGDASLVLLFLCASILFFTAITLRMRRVFAPHLKGSVVIAPILFAGLSMPPIFQMIRPSVYEASIMGGICFTLAGLWAIFNALTSAKHPQISLCLGGLLLALAPGCRMDTAVTAAFLAVMMLVFLLRREKQPGRAFPRDSACFLLPFCGIAALQMAFNLIRFGSILDNGFHYQLTGPATPGKADVLLSLNYVIPNMYSYLVRIPQYHPEYFPFISTPYINESMWPFFIHLPPDYYYPEPIAGLLTCAPFILLSPIPVLVALFSQKSGQKFLWCWWSITLSGAALLAFGILAAFIASTMRYMQDFFPLAALLSGWGMWQVQNVLQKHPVLRRCFNLLCCALLLFSLAPGLFLSFSGSNTWFEKFNPGLYYRIANFFNNLVGAK